MGRPGVSVLHCVLLALAFAATASVHAAAPVGAAQEQSQVPRDIEAAYKSRSYDEVITLAGRFLAEHPDSPQRCDVAYVGGQAAWQRKRLDEASRFLSVIVAFGESAGRWPEAALLLSEVMNGKGEHLEAAVLLSRLLSRPLSKGMANQSRDLLFELAKRRLSVQDISYIVYSLPQSSEHCRLLELLVEAEAKAGRAEELRDLLNRGLQLCGEKGRKTWEDFGRRAPGALSISCKDPYLVGIVCPVTGTYAALGEALVRGASVAMDEHNQKSKYKLRSTVKDTGGDAVRAVSGARELAVDEGVACIIGGLLSNPTAAIAGVTTVAGVPLVSPSATREEIAKAGPRVFQSALPRRLQVRALASAAREKLGASKAVALFPETSDGEILATSFKADFEERGGEAVMTGYAADETNFGKVLGEVSDEAPDCVFLAGESRDLVALIPQLAYYDVVVPVLATEAILAESVVELARKHLDRVVYAPDSYALTGDLKARFTEAFESKYGVPPEGFAVRGYLAMRLVVESVDSGARSHSALAEALDRRVFEEGALKNYRFLKVTGLPGVEVAVVELSEQ